ncbi:MAG: YhcH/YjgK/YiaL family protein [Chlorobiaceae bacterium]|nr:YhcH/YjgK/YiaL family protein [Chlorobiaceae bacterium]MBA4309811.1 YhcH/YjgK/YiaL family protein [Chlorobiaceae bacterium]
MIVDQLKNNHYYSSLGERFQKAFNYLLETDFDSLDDGKHLIEGEDIFALVSKYETKPLSMGKWESHKEYIDLQYVHSGREKMGYASSEKLISLGDYDVERDVTFYKGEGKFLVFDKGEFILLFPSDIHMPGIAVNISSTVKKIVVKIKI